MKKTPLGKGKNYKGLKKTGILSKARSTLKKTVLKACGDEAKGAWKEAREFCLLRDKNKCQIKGCRNDATQVHHIHLRSKRKDLLYHLPNLISLCDKHHFHQGSVKYQEQTQLIATSKNCTVEQLLKQAEE